MNTLQSFGNNNPKIHRVGSPALGCEGRNKAKPRVHVQLNEVYSMDEVADINPEAAN